jgi:hypothetical protein
MTVLADSGFFKDFEYQGGVKSTVSGAFRRLQAKAGKFQFWSEPSDTKLGKFSHLIFWSIYLA